LLIARVAFPGGQYFPIPNGSTPRYSASIIPTIRNDYSFGVYHTQGLNERVFVDTKQNLLSRKFGKRLYSY